MTRDEILSAIEQASTTDGTPGFGSISGRMEAVERLADTYMERDEWDREYLLESVLSAHKRFRAMLDAVS